MEEFLNTHKIKFKKSVKLDRKTYEFLEKYNKGRSYSVIISDNFVGFRCDKIYVERYYLFEEYKPWNEINQDDFFELILNVLNYKFSRSDIDPYDNFEYECEICDETLMDDGRKILFFNKYTTNAVCRKCAIEKSLDLNIDNSIRDERKHNILGDY